MNYGFKEWTLICDALGRGEQSIILRKGGIAEGRAGFHFEHDSFLLFPTLFHEQAAKLKLPRDTVLPPHREDGQIEISLSATVEWTMEVTAWEMVERLGPFHLWQEAEVAKRYHQDDSARVSLAFVRISSLSNPLVIADSPAYGGCRSWVKLPELPLEASLVHVLSDGLHAEREEALRSVLSA